MKPNSVTTQIKVIELCFPELLFTLLYKMVVTFFEPFEKDLSITTIMPHKMVIIA